jgi:hypothetical protein
MAGKKTTKSTATLPDDHGWKASPGHSILVVDRGLAMLEIPSGWVVHPTDDCLRVYDREPPEDDCALGISVLYLPPEWRNTPLTEMADVADRSDERKIFARDPVVHGVRPGLEWAWKEVRFEDAATNRPAASRSGLARSEGVFLLLTFDFWETDRSRRASTWDHLLETMVLGQSIEDPLRGPRLA